MTTKKPAHRPGVADETEKLNNREHSRAMYEGLTMYDIEQLFKVTRRTVQRKLSGFPPTGKRGAYDTWLCKNIAGLFIKPIGSMEEYIKAARPGDLPNELQKEYWNGLRAKQAFMAQEGHLWQTDRVIELFGQAFQHVRTSLLLLPDKLERRSALTDAQRQNIQGGIDAALDGMRTGLQDAFKDSTEPRDLPGVFNQVEEVVGDDLDGVFDPVDEDEDYDDDPL